MSESATKETSGWPEEHAQMQHAPIAALGIVPSDTM